MLDLRFISDNIEAVKENAKLRKVNIDFNNFSSLADKRLQLIKAVEKLRREQNEVAQSMKGKLEQEKRNALIAKGREFRTLVAEKEAELELVQQELLELQMLIPNMTHPDVPRGAGEEGNAEINKWGEPTSFSFEPFDHVELGNRLGLIDWESGSKVTGSKFYFLKREAVWLELALVRYALSILEEEGFTVHITPDLAHHSILESIGFNPRGEETQIYSIEGQDLCLIGTAEITLGGMHKDEILEESELPLLLAGVSHCFRTEAGAPGRASRGLYRVHQFTKIEMFAFTTPENSEETLKKFLNIEEKIFQGLGLPYRVVDCCTGDLGGQAYRKYDIEAWMPGRSEGGSYGEVTSASNCTDYQSRRLQTRYRKEGVKKPVLVHTLNGTAIAISRALVCILENYQQEDGSIIIPEVLRQWVGKDKIEARK